MTTVAFIGYGDIAERTSLALSFAGFTEMRGLCRHPQEKSSPIHIELVAGDATNASDLEQFIDASVDVIVITLTPNRSKDDAYFNGYVLPCRLLQHHLHSSGLNPRILYVSSTGVYDACDGEWIDETTVADPGDHQGKMLLQAEEVIRSAADTVSVLRCSGIYGPNRSRLAELLISGEATITPAWTNRIHADDVAGFLSYLIQHPEKQQPLFLVSDDEPLKQEEAYGRLANRLGVDLQTLARSDEIGRRGSKRIDNRLLKASGYQLLHPTYEPR
ncbi:NAD(P)H-binding protein [Pseudidiomarina insulisalsae]|uniref:NAD(P)-dependent oxidoreductase n=1 Tax=Pseudidiomarina insulisalsae TaxID=575789 RepID=A0A432YLK6_9GAMM|nr:NAD(P)H-binding protein [Pseudidiomarina insulisalsae]RUO61869.1 NAD(P)-dependent oxidoreductase [Pseudidiomarina insulisalsae]